MKNTSNRQKVIISIFSIAILLVAAYICFIIFTNTPEQRLKRQLSLGDKYLAELNYEDAIMAYSAAIDIDPKSTDAYVGLAKAYIGVDDYDAAYAVVEQGIEAVGIREALLTLLTEVERQIRMISEAAEENSVITQSGGTGIGNALDISAGASQESTHDEAEPEDVDEEEDDEIETEEIAEDDYDIPSAISAMTRKDGKLYLGNEPLEEVYSDGEIRDMGEYYEVDNVSFYFTSYMHAGEGDAPSDGGFEPTTVRVRKNAVIQYYSNDDYGVWHTSSAEDYYEKYHTFIPDSLMSFNIVAPANYKQGSIFSLGGADIDEEGYITLLYAWEP